MHQSSNFFILAFFLGTAGLAQQLHVAPGPVDTLSNDRGWIGSDRGHGENGPADEELVDSSLPATIAASLMGARERERLLTGPPSLIWDKVRGRLRLDSFGRKRRYLGTSAMKPLVGDFTLEFELTAELLGKITVSFGISDTRRALYSARPALFIEYGKLDGRRPALRWLLRWPGNGIREVGSVKHIAPFAEKLLRISRKGIKVVLAILQDYVLEARVEAQLPGPCLFSWIGSELNVELNDPEQRSIVYVDNIRGLDPDKPPEERHRR